MFKYLTVKNRSAGMRALLACAALACAATAMPLCAEEEAAASPHTFSANVGLFSEYVFRGITNSNEDPAIQGGFDYSHSSGFYLGTWASNIEFNAGSADTASIEVDLYGGIAGSFANGIGWDLGFIYYAYPEQDDEGTAEYDYYEGYASLNYTWENVQLAPSLETGIYYSPDYFGEDGDGIYVYGTFGLTLPYEFSPYLTLAYQDIEGDETSGPDGFDYFHYAVGMKKTMGQFTADLSWQDATDLTDCDDACEAVVFSISSSW